MAVAVVDDQTPVRKAFDLGAHFVLYKPLSAERAKTNFRAVRALMKRERRANSRIPVEFPVVLVINNGSGQERTVTTDLSEGGIGIALAKRPNNEGPMRLKFTLPGAQNVIECAGEVAWENSGRQAGIRFVDLAPEASQQIKSWLESYSPDLEKDDPPVQCKLTDFSPAGCYLEVASPFPLRTRVSMRVPASPIQIQGVVRVMHPEAGMGVEFAQNSSQQRQEVANFLQTLANRDGSLPDLLVGPEGLERDEPAGKPAKAEMSSEVEDPLVELFRKRGNLPAESFQVELKKLRALRGKASSKRTVTV